MPQKLEIRLGVIVENPGSNPELEFFGKSGNIKEIWTQWRKLWKDYGKKDQRLTFQQVFPILPSAKIKEHNRHRVDCTNDTQRAKPTAYESFCNFGSEGCRVHLSFHKSQETAERQFLKAWDIYGRKPGGHIWLENNSEIPEQLYQPRIQKIQRRLKIPTVPIPEEDPQKEVEEIFTQML